MNKKENRVVLYLYESKSKKAIEYDTAPHYLIPLFKIGEVAKMLNRSVETLRKYESKELIEKAKQYSVGQLKIRLYTQDDIQNLVLFFAQRKSVGRPSSLNPTSKINQKELMAHLNARIKQVD